MLASLGNCLRAPAARTELVSNVIPDMLRRDLAHKGLLAESVTVDWRSSEQYFRVWREC